MSTPSLPPAPTLHLIRRHPVVLDTDIARCCGVTPEKVRQSSCDFPGEFCFALDPFDQLQLAEPPPEPPRQAYTAAGAVAVTFRLQADWKAALTLTRVFSPARA